MPGITVDVGDVVERLRNVSNSYVTTRDPQEIAEVVRKILSECLMTNGRKEILRQGLDNTSVVNKLVEIYNGVLSKQKK